MTQPFASHPPGMAGHTGVAHGGHPMAQGHPSNQGVPGGGQQPGVNMVQQMHTGVTGPGVPQVSQAGPMMAGMMQGGTPAGVSGGGQPSAHALSHLNPGHQNQMFAQNQQLCEFISWLLVTILQNRASDRLSWRRLSFGCLAPSSKIVTQSPPFSSI